jgi:Fic family protein
MNLADYRAGDYENQAESASFRPSPIHHDWIIADGQVLQLLGQADRALGELNALARLVPEIDFFIKMYVAKEATHSSRINSAQTNIEDAFKSASLPPGAPDDRADIHNYMEAINFAIARLAAAPLSNRLLQETHAVLMHGMRGKTQAPSSFRTSQDWTGASLKNDAFVPPHHDHIPELMSDLEEFLQDAEATIPPLIKIAIAHYQFVTIHPFLEGNGRLGRLMIPLCLASEGLLAKPALYLSGYFERNQAAYVDHLMAVRQGNHMREWLAFFLRGVAETAQESAIILVNVMKLKDTIEREILPRFSLRRQDNAERLMLSLYVRPVVDVKAVAKSLNTTMNTATSLIVDLMRHGILVEMTGHRRNRLFIFRKYIDLFSA